MSHVTRATTDIEIKCGPCLQRAIQELAKDLPEGKVQYHSIPLDYRNRVQSDKRSAMVLTWKGYERGIGIDVVEGKLAFTTDDFLHRAEVQQVQNRVKQHYARECANVGMQRLGMRNIRKLKGERALLLHGVV